MKSSKDAVQLLNSLVTESPGNVLTWINKVHKGLKVPEDFNWLGLAEVSSHHARSKNNIEWAKIGVDLYEHLAKTANCREKYALLLSAMHLRAFFILKRGAVPKDPILDIEILVQWFVTSVNISLNEAEKKAGNWKNLSIEKIRELRDIKNQLAIFKELASKGLVNSYPEITRWLALRPMLP